MTEDYTNDMFVNFNEYNDTQDRNHIYTLADDEDYDIEEEISDEGIPDSDIEEDDEDYDSDIDNEDYDDSNPDEDYDNEELFDKNGEMINPQEYLENITANITNFVGGVKIMRRREDGTYEELSRKSMGGYKFGEEQGKREDKETSSGKREDKDPLPLEIYYDIVKYLKNPETGIVREIPLLRDFIPEEDFKPMIKRIIFNKHNHVFFWFLRHYREKVKKICVACYAAAVDNVELIRWGLANNNFYGSGKRKKIIKNLLEHGRINMIRKFIVSTGDTDSDTFYFASMNNDIRMVRWALDHVKEPPSLETLKMVTQSGYVDILIRLLNRGDYNKNYILPKICKTAIKWNVPEVVDNIRNRVGFPYCNSYVLGACAKYKKDTLFKRFYRIGFHVNEQVLYFVAMKSRLFKWLYSQVANPEIKELYISAKDMILLSMIRAQNLNTMRLVFDEAKLYEIDGKVKELILTYGNIPMLEYIHDKGLKFNDEACRFAAIGNKTRNIIWLRERGYPWHKDVLKHAIIRGNFRLVRYTLDNSEGFTFDFNIHSMIMDTASRPKIEQFLKERGIRIQYGVRN